MMFAAAFAASASVYRQNLPADWEFRQARKMQWHSATVPGTVHTDLMALNLIPDPFIGENERQVQWVDKEDWLYRTVFTPDSALLASGRIDLVFEGLDTYADVTLNDSLILSANNMFRTWEIPVKGLLREGENTLQVYFHSPVKVDLPKFDALPFHYDCGNDQAQNGGLIDKQVSVFARKAGYHYGWDWGPRLVTSGIWRPVYLRGYSDARISDSYFRTLSISDKKAELLAQISIESEADAGATILITDAATGQKLASKKTTLSAGVNAVSLPVSVKNPRLWWCNGLGSPELYDFKVELKIGGKVIDSQHRRTGIRTVEVVREEEPSGGRSFYFRLNGRPVFAKGANLIPCDNFLTRVTDSIYVSTVRDAADVNMNMLRVWGGGIYEDNAFYNACDSLGIMVWQDFMFACSLYPTEGEMLENIRHEAVDNIVRLRNHPSIVIWCGNNECLEAWYNWGLKRRYERLGYAELIWNQFKALYFNLLPKVVEEYAPDMYYHPSSPFSREDGSPEPERGDYHLWLVWGSEYPIDTYNKFRSRFFSEYGFQSFPAPATVRTYAPDSSQHFIDSDVMLAHQRAGAGANRKIERYLLASYPEPGNFDELLYLSQVLQGDAIKTAIEAHRRDRPHCMGTLFWQHNDCWPVASWSSRDYYGRWKAQHYFARKAFADVLVSPVIDGDSLRVTVVSDRTEPVHGALNVNAMTLAGTHIASRTFNGVKVNETATFTLPMAALTGPHNPAEVVITLDLNGEYENIMLPLAPKEMNLSAPRIDLTVRGNEVILKADTFVRALRLNLNGDPDCKFSDNFIDLLPGREYRITFIPSYTIENPEFTFTCLNQSCAN